MSIKNVIGLCFTFLLFFSSSPSHAITGVVSEAQAINVNCTATYIQCLGSVTATSKVFNLVTSKCANTSGGGCTSSTYYNSFSNNNDNLLAEYITGNNAIQPAGSTKRYKPVQNCVLITGGSGDGAKRCDVYIEKYEQAANGSYSWVTYLETAIQTNLYYSPTSNICPQSGSVYLAGLGCTTAATVRAVTSIPNNCDTCLQQTLEQASKAQVGNPISINSADKVELKQDLASPISFVRNYSSNRVLSSTPTTMGNGWKHNYDKRLSFVQAPNPSGTGTYLGTLIFIEENDAEIIFTRTSATGAFAPAFKDQKGFSLIVSGTNYLLTTPNGNVEAYNATGLLTKLTFKNGYFLNFAYTANILSTITDSYGRTLTYTHTNGILTQVLADTTDKVVYGYTTGNLTTATFNTTEITTYGYTANKLTSVTNPNNKLMSMFAYDTQGRAVETKSLAAANTFIHQYTMDYSGGETNYKTTKGNGATVTYGLTAVNNQKVINNSVMTDPTTYGSTSYGFTYDSNGYPKTYTDSKSNATEFFYSDTGLLTSIKRADNNETSYTYYPNTKLVERSTQTTNNGTRYTNYMYDSNNNVTQTSIDSNGDVRVWNNTYTTYGKIATLTEPNGNVTTYEYYPDNDTVLARRGMLKKVTNSLGQSVQITTYDTRGNPTTIVDQNNVSKTLTYDTRSRIKTEKVGTATNLYNYDLAGNLLNVTFANSLVLTFTYDNSNRLTTVSDNNGNSQVYTLDPDSDQPTNIKTNVLSGTTSVLNNVKNHVFDKLGRLTKAYRSNANEYSQFTYDTNNNVKTDRNANGNTNNYNYDSLDRLESASGRDGNPTYSYDLDGNIKTATLNSKTTTYDFNDFGEMTSLISPETGSQNITYDITNNITTKTDAKGVVHTYESDILGRIKNITHSFGATTESEIFTYDIAVNGVGKIASSNNDNATISYEYDTLGRISKKIQTVAGITKDLDYGYNAAGQLSSITYPSGVVVNYIYTKGLVTSITTSGGVVGTVLDLATYHPFDNGFPKNYRFNSNKNRVVNFDIDEKLTTLAVDGVFNNRFTMDAVGNYLNILDGFDATKSIVSSYDPNNKINLFTQNNVSFQPYYDGSFNRTSGGSNGQSMNFTYDYYTNRLTSYTVNGVNNAVTYDLNGHSLTEGTSTYTYDLRSNLVNFAKGSSSGSYTFNALGQRVTKTVGGVTTYFLYDESTNLIGEYDNSGNAVSEHIYLNGVPVGLVKGNSLYYVHTDHLGTPRSITNNANTTVWKWSNTDPFGGNLPTTQTIVYNKRFPGQYFDNESKLHYNYYRTYNPLTGRYIQSDPLGLAAGFNTYSYVGSNPLGAIDPLGLQMLLPPMSPMPAFNWNNNYAFGNGQSIGLKRLINNVVEACTPAPKEDIDKCPTYNRRGTSSQSNMATISQIISGEMWGRGYKGGTPTVNAYIGPLPEGISGVEFKACAVPTGLQGREGEDFYTARWTYEPGSEVRGIFLRNTLIYKDNSFQNEDFGAIKVKIIKNTQRKAQAWPLKLIK